jgi:hypothetical protein
MYGTNLERRIFDKMLYEVGELFKASQPYRPPRPVKGIALLYLQTITEDHYNRICSLLVLPVAFCLQKMPHYCGQAEIFEQNFSLRGG